MAEVTRDKDIREPLFEYLEEKYGKIRIIEEKMMGRSRGAHIGACSGLFWYYHCGICV